MATVAEEYLTSFARRAYARLAGLARELAGALASGDELRGVALRGEGARLQHGLASCGSWGRPDASTPGPWQRMVPTNNLSEEERLYIAGKLLPLERDALGEQGSPLPAPVPPRFTFDPIPPRYRGQGSSAPLTLSGEINETSANTLPTGSTLTVSRDGVILLRQVATVSTWSVVDNKPGSTYRAELTLPGQSTLTRQQVRALASPLLYGSAAPGATPQDLGELPVFNGQLNAAGVGRFAFTGTGSLFYICVPVEFGTLVRVTQPNNNNADISAAFDHTLVTFDFGQDGTGAYDVVANGQRVLGDFVLDAQFVLAGGGGSVQN